MFNYLLVSNRTNITVSLCPACWNTSKLLTLSTYSTSFNFPQSNNCSKKHSCNKPLPSFRSLLWYTFLSTSIQIKYQPQFIGICYEKKKNTIQIPSNNLKMSRRRSLPCLTPLCPCCSTINTTGEDVLHWGQPHSFINVPEQLRLISSRVVLSHVSVAQFECSGVNVTNVQPMLIYLLVRQQAITRQNGPAPTITAAHHLPKTLALK